MTTNLSTVLADECICGIFLGAIAHDLDHRGKSNVFEINEKTELSVAHPGKSPLESHHSAQALELLDSTGLLSGLGEPKKALVIGVVKECILATDMGKHSEVMKACAAAFGAGRLRLILSSSAQLLAISAAIDAERLATAMPFLDIVSDPMR